VQLGFIALSLLLGRRLDPAMYPASITTLLDEYAQEDPSTSARLRGWLERALQTGSDAFGSADAANRAFEHLPPEQKVEPAGLPTPVEVSRSSDVASVTPMPRPVPANEPAPVVPIDRAPKAPETKNPNKNLNAAARDAAVHQAVIAGASPVSQRIRKPNLIRWAVAVLAVVAVAEGIIIGGRWLMSPVVVMGPPSPLADLTPPSTTPAPLPPSTPDGSAAALPPVAALAAPNQAPAQASVPPAPVPAPAVPATSTQGTAAPAAAAPAPAAPTGRFGGVRVNSPIELQVFENGTLVGSTAGPIAVADGRHVFDLVSTTLGFRTRATVDVKPGQMASVPVTLPTSRININASPWAEVSINGTPAGQTPLANMSIPIGTHEVVFRHPQFGEQRHTVVVKADEVARISASFRP
jgi:hypothetical protein